MAAFTRLLQDDPLHLTYPMAHNPKAREIARFGIFAEVTLFAVLEERITSRKRASETYEPFESLFRITDLGHIHIQHPAKYINPKLIILQALNNLTFNICKREQSSVF